MLIDTRKSRIPAWILWVTGQTGLVTLAAISLDEGRASQYRKLLDAKPENIIVRVEATEVNHLLDASLDEMWWRMYGEGARERADALIEDVVTRERDLLRGALSKLWVGVVAFMKDEIDSDDLARIMRETRCNMPRLLTPNRERRERQ